MEIKLRCSVSYFSFPLFQYGTVRSGILHCKMEPLNTRVSKVGSAGQIWSAKGYLLADQIAAEAAKCLVGDFFTV